MDAEIPNPLPRSLLTRRLSPRAWAVLSASVGGFASGFAGLYPRFDDGKLRLVLAVTAAFFAGALVAGATARRSRAAAFALAVAVATVLGVGATILPAAILAAEDNHGGIFVAGLFFGTIFGAPTGFVYGLPLALLSAIVQPAVASGSLGAADRAARASGLWLVPVALVALAGTLALDAPRADVVAPSALALLASVLGLVVAVAGHVRLARRASWVSRVSSGGEPGFRVREIDPRDPIELLPRFGDGGLVVEWNPSEASPESAHRGAYRGAASGVAVALVDDRLTRG
jgi:hypothetical protein